MASGGAQQVIQQAPPGARAQVAQAAQEGFIAGFNTILLVAAAVAFAGADRGVRADPPEGLRRARRGSR